MTSDQQGEAYRIQRDLVRVIDTCNREYLIRLDMPLPPRRRRDKRRDVWLGLALFLPLYVYAMWRVLTG